MNPAAQSALQQLEFQLKHTRTIANGSKTTFEFYK